MHVSARHDESEPFVVLAVMPGGVLTVPASSAYTAQTAARHLTEQYPDTRVSWQASPHLAPGLVAVFGCKRPLAGKHLLAQTAHAFLIIPGQSPSPVWIALCGHHIEDTLFQALSHGMGQPCPDCNQRWITHHCSSDTAAPTPTTGRSIGKCHSESSPDPVPAFPPAH